MHAIMQPRLVKIQSTGAQANIRQANAAKTSVGEKPVIRRFLAVLLSALSAPAA